MGRIGKQGPWNPIPKDGSSGRQDHEQPGFPEREARLLDVQQQQGTVRLVLDSGECYELAAASLPEGIPPVGELVSAALQRALKEAAERKIVARKIFAMLDRRLQPVARIHDKLEERGFSRAAICAVLEQMQDNGIYSDRTYAEAYCRDCLLSKAVGRRYLVAKLRGKRVSASLATEVVAEILDRDRELELAKRASRLRWARLRGQRGPKAVAKVVRYLLGRGFDAGIANTIARSEEPTSDEQFEE